MAIILILRLGGGINVLGGGINVFFFNVLGGRINVFFVLNVLGGEQMFC